MARGAVFAGIFALGAVRWAVRGQIALALAFLAAAVVTAAVPLVIARIAGDRTVPEPVGPARVIVAVVNIGGVASAVLLLALIVLR
jgi:hypothetical protein